MKVESTQRTGRSVWPVIGFFTNWGVQLVLTALGIAAIFETSQAYIVLWCVLGSLYALGVVIVCARLSNRPSRVSPLGLNWRFHKVAGFVTWVFTIVPMLIGVTGAMQIIVSNSYPELLEGYVQTPELLIKIVGVWGMLLGWGFMHWGFAQIYVLQDARARPGRAIEFPDGTTHPGLVDYVYVSFTVGTTFAASDVSFMNTRTRWIVTVHSVLSFALNAFTIALAFNTIMGAGNG